MLLNPHLVQHPVPTVADEMPVGSLQAGHGCKSGSSKFNMHYLELGASFLCCVNCVNFFFQVIVKPLIDRGYLLLLSSYQMASPYGMQLVSSSAIQICFF